MTRTIGGYSLVILAVVIAGLGATSPADAGLADYVAAVQADAPLAYWRFEESAVSQPADNEMGISDYDGAYEGNVSLGTGIGGQATYSDDTTAYVSLTENVGGALDGRSTITIEAWIKNASIPTGEDNVVFNALINGGRSGVILQMDGAAICVGGRTIGSNSFQKKLVGFSSTNTWRHVVGVLDFGDDEIRVYIDGALANPGDTAANFEATSYSLGTPGADPSIGAFRNGDGLSRYFDGAIDEVALYGRELSDADIAEHYDLMPPPMPEPTTALLLGTLGLGFLKRRH